MNRSKKKMGRNDPCFCGSGKKFKKCCINRTVKGTIANRIMVSKDPRTFFPLKEAPRHVQENAIHRFLDKERKERDRVDRFGQIRPQISTVWQGQRWVTVRNRLYYAPVERWKFFPDFLRDYVPQVFGLDWCKAEAAKRESERHPVIMWREQAARYMNAQPPQADGSRVAIPSGALAAFTCFAYNLYVVADNGELDDALLHRLKNPEQFQGARHELFAEATCYRAGFIVQHENEKDVSRRHAEFTATHPGTGQLLAVEAKSRHREGVLGRPGKVAQKPSFTFAHLINDAVDKRPVHPLVIFLDTNLPYKWAARWLTPQAGYKPSKPMQLLLDAVKGQHDGKDPYGMIVFTNHPHHYATHDMNPESHLFSVVPEDSAAHRDVLGTLHMAAMRYGNIPQGFSTEEGEPPQPKVPISWPKVRYDFEVTGRSVTVRREGAATNLSFSTQDKDRQQAHSPLHEFLEDVGLSRVDAHMICQAVEAGQSVNCVYALK